MGDQNKKYTMDVEFIFKGRVTVTAESSSEAVELASKHVGLVIGGDIHSTLPDDEVDWDFGVHPEKIIGKPKSKESKSKEPMYFIFNGSYVGNAMMWWGKESRGYVADIRDAGHYTKEEALNICRNSGRLEQAFPVDYILNGIKHKSIIDSQRIDWDKKLKYE